MEEQSTHNLMEVLTMWQLRYFLGNPTRTGTEEFTQGTATKWSLYIPKAQRPIGVYHISNARRRTAAHFQVTS